MGSRDLNLGPHACAGSSLPPIHLPVPWQPFLRAMLAVGEGDPLYQSRHLEPSPVMTPFHPRNFYVTLSVSVYKIGKLNNY